ncbi:MAG: PKD domain-containing protein [Petrotogales bacterium]
MKIMKTRFAKAVITLAVTLTFVLPATVANVSDNNTDMPEFDDISTYQYWVVSGGTYSRGATTVRQSTAIYGDYPIGEVIWQYQITGGYDTSPKAIAPISDINDDGIDDVIVCSEDDYIRCFDGSAIGTGEILWQHEIYSGSLWCQNELTITEDIDDDGYNDVVVGTAWGDRSIHTLSGKTGDEIWKHDTHEYGNGGWVYQVDCSYDYNDDNVIDVLATTGGTSSGPRRVYCLDGEDGGKIWECPLGSPRGPGFSVIGIEDFTGDGQPDVLAGASNSAETVGYAYGINGESGSITWTFTVGGSSVWALKQIDDITNDGIKDVIIGDSFTGNIYGLDATNGDMEYSNSLGSVGITRFEKLNDVNGDDHPDIIPAHTTTHTTQVIDGQTGDFIWTHPVADQPWNVARTADISGDDIDDVLVGTLFTSNYCYFLNGVNGSELCSKNYYEAVDAIAAIPDVIGDYSMEMVAGGRNGKVTCFSGGLIPGNITADFKADVTEGIAPLTVHFTDLSTAENTTITSWEWDFDNDSIIDSEEQNPTWTYMEEGTYTVSLTVSDGKISDTETKIDYITALPESLEIGDISGGLLKIDAEIKNVGGTELIDVNWNITLDGSLILLGKEANGKLPSLTINETQVATNKPVFGLGRVTITVTASASNANTATKKAYGFILLFFVMVSS